MSTAPPRVYAARLVGLPIFDPQGDQVGKVRDLVVAIRAKSVGDQVTMKVRRGSREISVRVTLQGTTGQ